MPGPRAWANSQWSLYTGWPYLCVAARYGAPTSAAVSSLLLIEQQCFVSAPLLYAPLDDQVKILDNL